MYHKILVPMALDHNVSPQTLKVATALSGVKAAIITMHVYRALQSSVAACLDEVLAKEVFKKARALLISKFKMMSAVKAEIVKGHIYRTISNYAAANGIDCIVIGSHKPGLRDYLLGSTATRVARHAPSAVHVHRTT